MTKFYFVTPNSFLTLPPVNQIYKYLRKEYRIDIIQSQILDYEDFFEKEENYDKVNVYQNFQAYHKQSRVEKLRKTIRFIILFLGKVFSSRQKDEVRIVYTCELFPLFIALLFKNEKDHIIYHQFEVLGSAMNSIDQFSLWYVKNKFEKVDLAIFPEKNRAKHFFDQIGREDENQAFILPNTNNNSVSSSLRSNNVKTIVTHIGAIGVNHNLEAYIKAIAQLDRADYEFRFIGRLTTEVKKLIQGYNLDSI
jgi:hypothetical protein